MSKGLAWRLGLVKMKPFSGHGTGPTRGPSREASKQQARAERIKCGPGKSLKNKENKSRRTPWRERLIFLESAHIKLGEHEG
jgi:hypothetical protein